MALLDGTKIQGRRKKALGCIGTVQCAVAIHALDMQDM